jgi:hypothetical protein
MPETIHVKGEGGSVFQMTLPLQPDIAHRLSRGHLRRVNEDGTPWLESAPVTPAEAALVPSLPSERPALSASKGDWVGWAVRCGSTPDDAEILTKTDLIDQYGTASPEAAE